MLHANAYINNYGKQAYSVDPDQTAPRGAVCPGSTLFTNYGIQANSVNPDQTAPRGAV